MGSASQPQDAVHVALDGLVCVRGDRLLFGPITMAAHAGDAVTLTGPNGVGKSSLLRIIAGLLTPAGGCCTATGGFAISDDRLALDEAEPLSRALGFWAGLDGAADRAVPEALDALGIGHLAQVPVRMLSTGQCKRASIARVMVSGAPIWLLDEPVNGLDANAMDRLGSVVARHRGAGGIVIAASHVALPWPATHTITLERAAA